MKKFNKVISIEVSVDMIAEQLLSNFNPEFKHKELVVESIVGRMIEKDSLGYLYNSLNGYNSNVNFEVGDWIKPTDSYKVYGYWTPESLEAKNQVRGEVKEAKIIEINPFADAKLKILYLVPKSNGEFSEETTWVNHINWNKISYALGA